MNSCILMAEIIQAPELRYTSDTQTPITEMVVQFPGFRPDDPPATLKVVGWGNLAQEIQEKFHAGDKVVIEGRLSMNTIDRPEGFKEKRAELTAQRVHALGAEVSLEVTATPVNAQSSGSYQDTAAPAAKPAKSAPAAAKSSPASYKPAAASTPEFDDIPF